MEEKEYKRFTISVPPDLYEQFELFRNKLNLSRSDAIRKAMRTLMVRDEDVDIKPGNVVGCITMILSHEHFDPSHYHNHDHDDHDDEDDDHVHDHDYSSRPIYASVHQTDLILANDLEHHYSDVIISKMHVHLEFDKCLEIIAVSGSHERIVKLKENLQKLTTVLSIGFFVVDKEVDLRSQEE